MAGELGTGVERNLADHFDAGGRTIMYTVIPTSYVTASETGGVLSVSFGGSNVPYSNQSITVSASDGVDTVDAVFNVRRNKAPIVAPTFSPIKVTVGTQYPHDTEICALVSTIITDDTDDTLTYTGEPSLVKDKGYVTFASVKTGVNVQGLKSTGKLTTDGELSFKDGKLDIDVTAKDSGQETITVTKACEVRVDEAPDEAATPVLRNLVLKLSDLTAGGEKVDANKHFIDPEEESFTYKFVSSSTSVATVTHDGTASTAHINAIGEGTATITVTATEADGTNKEGELGFVDQTATATFMVEVQAE